MIPSSNAGMNQLGIRSTVLVLFVAALMATSPVAMAAGGVGGAAEESIEPGADQIQTQSVSDVEIATELESQASEETIVEVFVRLDAAESDFFAAETGTGEPMGTSQAALEYHASISQAPLETFAADSEGVEVLQDFWITNAVLVEVDTTETSLDDLATVDGVTELHENAEVELVEPELGEDADEPAEASTYGLEQVNAPEVWEDFDTRGEGASVAVLDTGLDADHVEFEDFDTDNWAEFDDHGNLVDIEPRDQNGHGTHVAGTVLGGDASGINIGVAPEAELYAGNVLPDGSGTLAQIVAGIQWAVEEDVDVINMSLGGAGYPGIYVDVIENALAEDTLVISSSGNSGVGSTGAPANVYSGLAIGATDETEDIADFSTGIEVDTNADWGPVAPDDWPDTYETPDVSAPGVAVLSAYVGPEEDPYAELQGTSMAAPHAAGVAALLASEYDVSGDQLKETLEETAAKPAEPGEQALADAQLYDNQTGSSQTDRLFDDDVRDVRYGFGIVDAYAAMTALAADSATIEGTVTADGDALADVAVTVDGETTSPASVVTDDDGAFAIDVLADEFDLTASTFGLAGQASVSVDAGETESVSIELEDSTDATLETVQPEEITAGSDFDLEATVANLETYSVEATADATEDVTVTFDGDEVPLGEPVDVGEDGAVDGTVTISVAVDEDQVGETVELIHTFAGAGDAVVETGPTDVLEPDAEDIPLEIVAFDPPSELPYDSVSGIVASFENTGDFTQENVPVFHAVDDAGQTLLEERVTVEPGETVTVEFGPYGWWSELRGPDIPGDLDHQVSVGEPPTLLDESAEPDDESAVETITIFEEGEVTGQVTDAHTGDPLSGVQVIVIDADGEPVNVDTSGGDGVYSVTGVNEPGQYTVVADATGYADAAEVIETDGGDEVVEQDLELGSEPAFEFSLEAGETYAVGVPGPIEGGTVGDIVPEDADATVYAYDVAESDLATDEDADLERIADSPRAAAGFSEADPDDEVDALDALLVEADEDLTLTITMAGAPDDGTIAPPETSLEEGWNFVAAPLYAPADDAFAMSSAPVTTVMSIQDAPASQMTPPAEFDGIEVLADDHVDPFGGYFVFAAESGTLGGAVHEGMTLDGVYDNLGVDADRFETTIVGENSALPVADATVDVLETPFEVTTAEDGSFDLPSLPAGVEQTVVVDHDDHAGDEVVAEPGDLETLSLQEKRFFAVEELSVTEDDEYTITFDVVNLGASDTQGTVDVILGPDLDDPETIPRFDEGITTVASSFVELDSGERTTIEIEEDLEEFVDAGDQIGVFTAEDVAVVNLSEPGLTFDDQTVGTTADGEDAVFVSDVVADAGQQVVVEAAGEQVGELVFEDGVSGDRLAVSLDADVDAGSATAAIVDGDEQIASETATIYEESVTFTPQVVDSDADEQTVYAAATDLSAGDEDVAYTVDLYPADADAETAAPIGSSAEFTGSEWLVSIDVTEPIESTDEFSAVPSVDGQPVLTLEDGEVTFSGETATVYAFGWSGFLGQGDGFVDDEPNADWFDGVSSAPALG